MCKYKVVQLNVTAYFGNLNALYKIPVLKYLSVRISMFSN